jgi:NTE family protein
MPISNKEQGISNTEVKYRNTVRVRSNVSVFGISLRHSLFGVPCSIFAFLFCSLSISTHAQPCKNLVFEGGGIRGIAYCGALEVLQQHNLLDSVKRVAGTSVGAIQATVVALNYTPQEMATLIADLNLRHFNDGGFMFIGGAHRLRKNYGWYKGNKLRSWIGHLIETKTGNADLTFGELHMLAQTKGYKDLYVTGTDLTRQCLEVFSYENHPNMKIKDAVRISVSIPLYYGAVFMDSLQNITYRPRKNTHYRIFVDGGIIGNFPIHIFDHPRYMAGADTSQQSLHNANTIGIRLDSDAQIRYDLDGKGLAPFRITGMKSYMGAFYNVILENLNRQSLTPEDWKRTISISTAGVGPKVRKLAVRDKEGLVNSGKKGAEAFLNVQR